MATKYPWTTQERYEAHLRAEGTRIPLQKIALKLRESGDSESFEALRGVINDIRTFIDVVNDDENCRRLKTMD